MAAFNRIFNRIFSPNSPICELNLLAAERQCEAAVTETFDDAIAQIITATRAASHVAVMRDVLWDLTPDFFSR